MRVLESRACQQLQSLDCGDVDESTLNYLAKLATLKDLSVHLLNPLSAGIVFNEGFVHLQTLSLTVEDMSTAIAFLSSTQLSLKAIKIRMPSTRPQPRLLASLEQLFSMLSTSHCHTRLTQFHLVRQPTSLMVGDIFHEGTLDIAALRPLFSFTKMRCVDIDGLCSFDLNDDSLAELANAWPHLEELTLNLSSGWQSTSEITFKGLRSLIQACPLLKSLALAIDATQLNPISRATPEDDIHNDKIEVLDLEDSTIENPIAVARILGKLFRSLKRVNVSPEEEELYELWDDVNSHLRKAQAKKQKIRL
ncbi:hypothetical protein BJ138DRAFT_82489 [Hygrophoropsis aurantiaca]|uniref:Uncharacterized protein n=1 Tax=Hygrophoropsis aurantiaca TaxID=72124 RepID=A0ACB7ZRC7_9AGAM|nr:hypothetical protein BJ138DRAFT_82489 [Hygrophoropsis aurantiaca]